MASQTASILVSDLVGSTELRVRLGEDRAEHVRRTHDRLLTEAVTGNDGTVVKFLGDGVLAMFAGAADALAAAVAIQQVAAAHSDATEGEPLELRIGISAGDVTVEDGDCFGTPVVEASRLCSAASGGQILAAAVVQLLARGRGGHAFLPCGAMELKGLPDPVETVEVRWERAVRSALADAAGTPVPLPAALAATALFPMAGRHAARETLKTRWKEALVGERRIVLVSGEPGIGKTRLVTELARDAAADAGVVALGRCDEELRDPYRPFAEAVRHLVAHLPDDLLAAHVAAAGGELARLAPELTRRVPSTPAPLSSDTENERLALFDAVTDLVQRVAVHAPVLLVLDDLHWADRSSLLLLRHLLRATTDTPLLVVATYRDTDLVRTHPLAAMLADLRREPAAERLDLQGLDEAEVVALLEAVGGQPLDADGVALARALQQETDGNPFFVGEVLLHLNEAGAIYRTDGGWSGDRHIIQEIGIPQGIREVIGRRVSALPDDTAELLGLASVLGAEIDATALARMAGSPVDDVVTALEVACARSLIAEVPGRLDHYRFTHALVRQTLYDELPTNRRVRLHAKAAAASADHGALPTVVAHHYVEAAALGHVDDAITWSRRAADAAEAALAYEQAIVHLRTALDVEELRDPPDPRRRAELLLALGTTMDTAGDQAPARAILREAADLAAAAGCDDIHVEAALEFGGLGSIVDFADGEGVDLLDRITPIVGPGDSPEHVKLLLRRSMWVPLTAPREARREPVEAALAMAERLGDDALRILALAHHVMDGQRERRNDERLDELSSLVELSIRLGQPLQAAFAHWEALDTLLGMGRLRDAVRGHEAMIRDVEAAPTAYGRILARYLGAVLGALQGPRRRRRGASEPDPPGQSPRERPLVRRRLRPGRGAHPPRPSRRGPRRHRQRSRHRCRDRRPAAVGAVGGRPGGAHRRDPPGDGALARGGRTRPRGVPPRRVGGDARGGRGAHACG